jgi:MFS family permease
MSSTTRLPRGVWIGLATSLVIALAAAIGFAINAPLFALTLNDKGLDGTQVGLLMTVAGLSAVLCTPIVPLLMGRLRISLIIGGALVASSLMFLLYLGSESIWAWAAIRFGFSASLTILFVASEAWFLELAPESHRGRLLGLYAASFAGGFGIGGLMIAQLTHIGPAAPLVGAAIMLLPLPLLLLSPTQPTKPEGDAAHPSALWARLWLAPALFVPALAMGAIETGAFNLFPIWVRKIGFEDATAGYLIAASALGNVILQGPIGFLADRFGQARAMLAIAIIGIAGPIGLAMIDTPYQAYAICFFWSGSITGFYTLGLMGVAQRFGADHLAGANAAFGASYGVGQLGAPVVGGFLMETIGPTGFLAGLSIMALLPVMAIMLQRQRHQTLDL